MTVFAAALSDADLISPLLPRLGILIALVVAGGILLLVLRRFLHPNAPSNDPGLSLDDLRRMHHEGLLSDEEYETARNQIVRAYRDIPGPRAARGEDTGHRAPMTPPDSPPESGHSDHSP